MVETTDPSPQETHDADDALKKKLLSRIALVGVLIVALLGGLAVIDALYVPPPRQVAQSEPAAEPAKSEPAKTEEAKSEEAKPEAAKTEVAKAEEAKPAENKATPEEKPGAKTAAAPHAETKAPVQVATAPAKVEAPAVPEGTRAVAAPPPPPTKLQQRALTPPATARPASIKPAEPALALPRREADKELARIMPPIDARHAPASRPLAQSLERERQFVVQMGVFNNLANAEDLRAKLELAGLPAQIEARVQVGPFKTKAEAELAREKLRAAGMEIGILTAIRR